MATTHRALLTSSTSQSMPVRGRPFSQEPNEQSSSPLFAILPPELINHVLRYVLLPTSKLQAKKRLQGRDDKNPQLSAQLLRCCQKLYTIGESVLYGDNILHIQLHPDIMQIGDLALCIRYRDPEEADPVLMHTLQKPVTTLADLAVIGLNDLAEMHDIRSQYRAYFSSVFQGVLRIRCVKIEMGLRSRQQTWDCIRLLRDIVHNKRVTVEWQDLKMTKSRTFDLLRSFYQWRCLSIEFAGLPKGAADKVQEIVSTVTGSTPVDDLFHKACSLYTVAVSHPDLSSLQQTLDDIDNGSSEDESNIHEEEYILGGDDDLDSDEEDDSDSDEEDDSDSDDDKEQRREEMRKYRAARWSDTQLSAGPDPYELWTIIRRGDSSKFRTWQARALPVQTTQTDST